MAVVAVTGSRTSKTEPVSTQSGVSRLSSPSRGNSSSSGGGGGVDRTVTVTVGLVAAPRPAYATATARTRTGPAATKVVRSAASPVRVRGRPAQGCPAGALLALELHDPPGLGGSHPGHQAARLTDHRRTPLDAELDRARRLRPDGDHRGRRPGPLTSVRPCGGPHRDPAGGGERRRDPDAPLSVGAAAAEPSPSACRSCAGPPPAASPGPR